MTNFAGMLPPTPLSEVTITPAPVAPTIAVQPPPTTGERLTAALTSLRWSQGLLATTLRLSPSTVRHWVAGRAPPPPALLDWLERLAAHHEADPMPVVTVRPGNPTWR
jgi:DNA-binding transcriptional regulator YiaG